MRRKGRVNPSRSPRSRGAKCDVQVLGFPRGAKRGEARRPGPGFQRGAKRTVRVLDYRRDAKRGAQVLGFQRGTRRGALPSGGGVKPRSHGAERGELGGSEIRFSLLEPGF